MQRTERSRIFLSPPHKGGQEQRFISEALESNYIAPEGPQIETFEQEFSKKVGISYSLAVCSGTAAMHLALRCLGIGPGDEVIASTLTFIGSVAPVVFLGATPVFVDSEPSTWNMDPGLLEEELRRCDRLGHLPKAVVPTDLYGQCADYNRILPLCETYEIPVIADSAEALGATYDAAKNEKTPVRAIRHAGAGAKAAVFSFNGNKIITTSGGGMLTSEDSNLIEHGRKLSRQAREDLPYYEHVELGYNYRMSNILAALGRAQLKVLDERVERKRGIFNYYRSALGGVPGIEFMPEAEFGKSNRWLTVILITPEAFGADREEVRLALEKQNIESRPVWKPMHLQPVFGSGRRKSIAGGESYRSRSVGGRVAQNLFRKGLCLPSGTAMTREDLDRVISVILSCNRG